MSRKYGSQNVPQEWGLLTKNVLQGLALCNMQYRAESQSTIPDPPPPPPPPLLPRRRLTGALTWLINPNYTPSKTGKLKEQLATRSTSICYV